MTAFTADFLNILKDRGFLHQHVDLSVLDARMNKGLITAYSGFDATGDSLHVGHLLPLMMLRWLQKTGHRPVVLVGGATTKVGDPSGKDQTRQLLSDKVIADNINGLKQNFEQFLTFGTQNNAALLVNNADWLDALDYISFLREIGPHFTINRMLGFDSVRLRLEREQPLTFLEFNYMILQSYDFVHLSRHHDCCLQIGGSDQWGNIINGIDLSRRLHNTDLFGLTCPLITTATGAKMGKSVDGAIWLSPARCSAHAYYQFWRNTDDQDVSRFLKLFTELPLSEIAELEKLRGPDLNEAKKILAFEATALCHGTADAEKAARTARQTFEQGEKADGLPTLELVSDMLPISILDLLQKSGLTDSKGAARRLIRGKGARLDDRVIEDETLLLHSQDLTNAIKLSAGKKRHVLVKKEALK